MCFRVFPLYVPHFKDSGGVQNLVALQATIKVKIFKVEGVLSKIRFSRVTEKLLCRDLSHHAEHAAHRARVVGACLQCYRALKPKVDMHFFSKPSVPHTVRLDSHSQGAHGR